MKPEKNSYKVIMSPGTYNRMYDHFMFLAQVNEAAADRLLKTILDDLKSLEKSIRNGLPYERPYTPVGKYRYLLSAKIYRIVFMIENATVFVDDIQDCREDDDKSIISEKR